MSKIVTRLNKIAREPDCEVYPPTSLSVDFAGINFPVDLAEFLEIPEGFLFILIKILDSKWVLLICL